MIGFALETQRPPLNNWCALCSRWTGEERENRERAPDNQTEIDRKARRFLTGSSLPAGEIPFSLCNEKTAMRARSRALVSHVMVGVHAGRCMRPAHDRVCVWPSSLSPTQTLTRRGSKWVWLSPGGELTYLGRSVFVSPLAGWREPGDSVAPAGYTESLFHRAGYCVCVFALYGAVNHWMGERFFTLHLRFCLMGWFVREWTWEILWCVRALPLLFVYLESWLHLLCFYSSLGIIPRYL